MPLWCTITGAFICITFILRNVLLQCFTSTVKLFIGKRRNTLFCTRQKLSRCEECALTPGGWWKKLFNHQSWFWRWLYRGFLLTLILYGNTSLLIKCLNEEGEIRFCTTYLATAETLLRSSFSSFVPKSRKSKTKIITLVKEHTTLYLGMI